MGEVVNFQEYKDKKIKERQEEDPYYYRRWDLPFPEHAEDDYNSFIITYLETNNDENDQEN